MSISTPSRGQTAKSPELFRIDPNWLGSGTANPGWLGLAAKKRRSTSKLKIPGSAGRSRNRVVPLRRPQSNPAAGQCASYSCARHGWEIAGLGLGHDPPSSLR